MKRLLILPGIFCLLIGFFGCSEDSQILGPNSPGTLGQLVPRPAFVDTRSPGQISSATLSGAKESLILRTPPPTSEGNSGNTGSSGKKFAYVVGISDYQGTINDLKYADDDGREIVRYLTRQGFIVRSDFDLTATSAAVEAGLDWLRGIATSGNEVAFYYSGHATRLSRDGSAIISTDMFYLTHTWVMQKINAINCTKKTVALDACVLGDFHDDVTEGTVLATASDTTDSYDAPDLKNGAWTYYFLDGAVRRNKESAEAIAVHAEQGMGVWGREHRLEVSPTHTDKFAGDLDM